MSHQNRKTKVESRTQGSRPRTQKNPRTRTDFARTDPLEAKVTNVRGQGPRIQRASVSQKKKIFEYFPRNFKSSQKSKQKKRSLLIYREVSGVLQDQEKNGDNLGPFSTNQKIVLSSAEDRAFLRTCKLEAKDFKLCPLGLCLCRKT